MTKELYTKIPDRGQIIISGDKAGSFLQNIITNDINLLIDREIIYSCLLSPQGKILHDFFITQKSNEYLIECEAGDRLNDLYDRLIKYRLRTPIDISYKDNIEIYQIWGKDGNDPRLKELGTRTYNKADNIQESTIDNFINYQRSMGVPYGSMDLKIEKYHPLECNLDKLNAISFKKGCYIGQEIVSRVKNRGLLKKRLYPVNGEIKMIKITEAKQQNIKTPKWMDK